MVRNRCYMYINAHRAGQKGDSVPEQKEPRNDDQWTHISNDASEGGQQTILVLGYSSTEINKLVFK